MRRRSYPFNSSEVPQPDETDLIRQGNQAAADQWSMRVKNPNLSLEEQQAPSRLALIKALGVGNPSDAPSTAELMSRFRSAPPSVRAGIYQRGGAQFIGGVEGAKLLETVAQNREKALDEHTNEIVSHMATGKINYELDPSTKKPKFYQLVDDETDPLGQRKKKLPLNAFQLSLMDRGFKNGSIPNPFSDQVDPALIPPLQSRMSSADFQATLDARARAKTSDVTEFQKVLDARANADAGVLASSKTPIEPSMMPPLNGGMIRPSAPPVDTAAALGNAITSAPGQAWEMYKNQLGAAPSDLAHFGRGLVNTGTDVVNALTRFGAGALGVQAPPQFSRLPVEPPVVQNWGPQSTPPLDSFLADYATPSAY